MGPPLHDWFLGTTTPAIRVLDGGVSTHLEERADFSCRQLWSSSLLWQPDTDSILRRAHTDWNFCDVLSTVTYQCHYQQDLWPPGMTTAQMDAMFERGIRLANECQGCSVALSLGCYGAALANGAEYTGDYGGDPPLRDFHKTKLKHAGAGVDAVAFETIPNAAECRVLAEILASTELPCAVWVSLACRNSHELNDGTPVKDVVPQLLPHVSAIGVNCGKVEDFPGLVRILLECMDAANLRRGLVLYPNSGEVWKDGAWEPGTSTSDWVDAVHHLVTVHVPTVWKEELGRSDPCPRVLVGGCCRTTPSMIRALKERVLDDARMN